MGNANAALRPIVSIDGEPRIVTKHSPGSSSCRIRTRTAGTAACVTQTWLSEHAGGSRSPPHAGRWQPTRLRRPTFRESAAVIERPPSKHAESGKLGGGAAFGLPSCCGERDPPALSAIDDSTFARVVIAAPLGCPVAMWEAQTRLCGPIFRSGRADRRPEPQPYQLVSDSYANCKYGALCQSSATFRTRGWTAFSPACGTMAINAAPPPNIQRKRGSH